MIDLVIRVGFEGAFDRQPVLWLFCEEDENRLQRPYHVPAYPTTPGKRPRFFVAHGRRLVLGPWPDSIPGLIQLRSEYLIAPLSNGHIRLLTNIAKRTGIPWDLILSAELSGHYKPDEEAYLTAVDYLDLQPAEVMMVAAHERDLEASREVGLRTAYVHRPFEWGPERADDVERPSQSAYDVIADDLVDLAEQLGSEPIL
ncbi:haloacid dehalogenase [Halalkalicoccus jeotgali B3]|uniref:Haloacid dehalogenase n=1 Tax=Halalkalicoccus jeotgali (strain DSM 18796 / CECT 7217 / JCM 14584 / KCTC 4019 / B3) TaxID=795797 RepID=D8JCN1_HALJB|nr:haloacid dehalogenase, type II [Halalkalicoccus jeotgali B3]ELY41707.1 haloacid dehalogenase [Halalkalicoccus jeotgali B3]